MLTYNGVASSFNNVTSQIHMLRSHKPTSIDALFNPIRNRQP